MSYNIIIITRPDNYIIYADDRAINSFSYQVLKLWDYEEDMPKAINLHLVKEEVVVL